MRRKIWYDRNIAPYILEVLVLLCSSESRLEVVVTCLFYSYACRLFSERSSEVR